MRRRYLKIEHIVLLLLLLFVICCNLYLGELAYVDSSDFASLSHVTLPTSCAAKSMNLSQNQAILASIAVASVCVGALLVLKSGGTFVSEIKLLFASSEKRAATKKLQRIANVLRELSSEFAQAKIIFADVFSERQKLKQSSTRVSEPSDPSKKVSAYYHFDSTGNKFPNKWDSYDVDEALKEMDAEDETLVCYEPSCSLCEVCAS